MRGKREVQASVCPFIGLIPAGAGQTPSQPSPPGTSTAHPRGCGANSCRRVGETLCAGSSPRVRGKHRRRPTRRQARGLIPAGAGQTGSPVLRLRGRRAHPRGCGANQGAPPGRDRRAGLIPAGAGQTPSDGYVVLPEGAHPRGCGANLLHTKRNDNIEGSSPRVRGKLDRFRSHRLDARLIPAGAGQTLRKFMAMFSCGAHPRGCGANRHPAGNARRRAGSSPRVRGKPAA